MSGWWSPLLIWLSVWLASVILVYYVRLFKRGLLLTKQGRAMPLELRVTFVSESNTPIQSFLVDYQFALATGCFDDNNSEVTISVLNVEYLPIGRFNLLDEWQRRGCPRIMVVAPPLDPSLVPGFNQPASRVATTSSMLAPVSFDPNWGPAATERELQDVAYQTRLEVARWAADELRREMARSSEVVDIPSVARQRLSQWIAQDESGGGLNIDGVRPQGRLQDETVSGNVGVMHINPDVPAQTVSAPEEPSPIRRVLKK